MAEKNKFYRDFSNRKPFNNIPCKEDEELVPVVLNDDVKATLKSAGLDWNNVETWHFPHSSKKIPVAFVPNSKGNMDTWMKWFNEEAKRFIQDNPMDKCENLSLDKFIEDMSDDDKNSFDPTATTAYEDLAETLRTIDILVDSLSSQNVVYGNILRLIIEGYDKKEVLDMVDTGKGKTQGYALITTVLEMAKDLYDEMNE